MLPIVRDRGPNTEAQAEGGAPAPTPAPGRQTRTDGLPVQRKADASAPAILATPPAAPAHEDPFGLHLLDGGVVQRSAGGPSAATATGAVVQRKAGLSGSDWRNAVIDGVNRVQEIIRKAQTDKKGRLELDLIIEPDFVGLHSHSASGKAPKGADPDGWEVAKAAERAFENLVDDAPTVRKVFTVVLERTKTGWDRPQFTHTGETRTLDDADLRTASSAGWDMANQLDLAHAAGRNSVRFQVAMSDAGVKVVSWQATGTGKKSDKKPSTQPATESFENLASTMQGRVLIYEITHEADDKQWTIQSWNMLGEVKPIEPAVEGEDDGEYMDEGEMAIEDVQAARRLVLTTAAMAIAEHDPTRLDNLIYSVGPFGVLGVLKAGKLAKLGKLGKLAKVFGRPGRRVFGETKFRGLVQNRKLSELTDNEITHAFSNTPFKLSSHANMRLRDARTGEMGYETLNDVAKLLNDGIVQATKKADDANEVIEIAGSSMKAVVNVETNVIISFKPF